MQTGDLGSISLNPRGNWTAGEYTRLDYVAHGGSSWTATGPAGLDDVPGISDVWMLSAHGVSQDHSLLTLVWDTVGIVETGYLDLSRDNGLLLRSAYPGAWAKLERAIASGSTAVTDEEAWQAELAANSGVCGKYSTGDGATTFRVPLLRRRISIGAPEENAVTGSFLPDQMQGHWHNTVYPGDTELASGTVASRALRLKTMERRENPDYWGAASPVSDGINGDPRTGSITHGPLVIYTPLLKMYGAVIDDSEANIAELIQQSNTKLDTGTYEAHTKFSTEEWDTGRKWIDGRTIYGKYANFGSLPGNATKTVPHGIADLDLSTMRSKGYAYGATGSSVAHSFPIGITLPQNGYFQRYFVDPVYIQVIGTIPSWTVFSCFFYLEYCKTV